MEKEFKFEKGEECHNIVGEVKNEIEIMLDKEFEEVDARLKLDTKITIKIEELKNKK